MESATGSSSCITYTACARCVLGDLRASAPKWPCFGALEAVGEKFSVPGAMHIFAWDIGGLQALIEIVPLVCWMVLLRLRVDTLAML
eukprot:6200417-Pleurochrysis_carterae.AAC.3